MKEYHTDEKPERDYAAGEIIRSPLSSLHYNLRFHFDDSYPAKMPDDFARDMILLYSKKGDAVWDGCCGSGVVPRAARRLGRDGYGTDVNPKAIEICRMHDPAAPQDRYMIADAGHVRWEHKFDLVLSSLPFGLHVQDKKNHYSDEPEDISHAATYGEFYGRAGRIISNYYDSLKPNGVCVLDARDRSHEGRTHCLILEFLRMAQDVGFELVTRYYYDLVPYRQLTYTHAPTGFVRAMPAAMDAIVLAKPADERLEAHGT